MDDFIKKSWELLTIEINLEIKFNYLIIEVRYDGLQYESSLLEKKCVKIESKLLKFKLTVE